MNKNEINFISYLSTQEVILRGTNIGVHSHFHAG